MHSKNTAASDILRTVFTPQAPPALPNAAVTGYKAEPDSGVKVGAYSIIGANVQTGAHTEIEGTPPSVWKQQNLPFRPPLSGAAHACGVFPHMPVC